MEDNMCKYCSALAVFAKCVQKDNVIDLSATYKAVFPLIQYKTEQAVRKVMQMPVSVIQMTLNGPGSQKLYVLENVQ